MVTELGPNGKAHVGLIVEVSGKSLTLKLVTAIAHGTPVQLEAENMLMLGEIVRCEPADDGFRLALALRHSLEAISRRWKN